MRIKKLFGISLLFFLVAILPMKADAAGSGTMYQNFSEITNAANLTNDQTYIFLTKHYSSADAVTTLSGGNATLTITTTANGGSSNMQSYGGYTYDKYVDVAKAGTGFDTCLMGAIYYGAVSSFEDMVGTPGTGWYYWCDGGGVCGVGPFYAYTYDTVTFTESDVVVTVDMSGVTDTVTKDKLSVKVKGYNVTDYTITDGSISDSDMTIGLNVGGVDVTKNVGSTITFTTDSNSTGSNTTVLKLPGTPIHVPSSDGTYAGYTFKGWSLTPGSSTVNYLPGSEFNMDTDTALYAVWVPIVYYTVTINGTPQSIESGTTLSVPSSLTKATEYYDNGSAIIPGANDATVGAVKKIAYTFAGWKNSATNQYWDFSTPVSSNLTLVPDFAQKVFYKVMFDKNNTASGYTTGNQWIESGKHVTEVSAPSTVTTGSPATNYYFIGWNTRVNGSGEYWNFYGDVVDNALTLYAQWNTVDSYNITFDDNLTDPTDDYVWNTGSLTQAAVAKTDFVTAPTMARVDYTFDGWYTDPNCHASNAYNLNRSLSDNNIAGLDTDHDKSVMLFAKWTPKYNTENDVLVPESSLAEGSYAAYYSSYISAFENNSNYNTPSATSVFRNFHLVSASGTMVNPSTLPAGLHLNSRTGEVYGIPSTVGEYTFYVRIANDDGRWISLTYPITVTLAKAPVSVDMTDDDTGLTKTYGDNDPGFYSDQLAVTAGGTAGISYDNDGSDVTLAYDYTSEKSTRAAHYGSFHPSASATLKYAPDINDSEGSYIPADTKSVLMSMSLTRASGEDAGAYKLYLAPEGITGSLASNYSFSIADKLSATTLSAGEDPATEPEYVFTIASKAGASYSNGATVEYGVYSSGSDVKAALTTGTGLVSNSNTKITDAFQSVVLTSSNISGAQKLKADTYATGFTSTIVNTATPRGTSTAVDATTTANYVSPAFSITITQKALEVSGKTHAMLTGASFTTADLIKLVGLNSVLGDEVGITISSVTIGGTMYDLTDNAQKEAANAALANLAKTAGTNAISVGYSDVLTGADAQNYSITAGTVANGTLVVRAPSGGGGVAAVPDNTATATTGGQSYSVGTASTSGTGTKVMVDAEKFNGVLKNANSNGEIVIPFSGSSQTSTASLKVSNVEDMANKGVQLNVNVGDVQYKLNTSAVDTKGILADLGADDSSKVTFEVNVIKPGDATQSEIAGKISTDGAAVILPAVEFTVTATYNGKSHYVSDYSKFVTRSIELTAEQAEKITTAIIYRADGTYYHAPTFVRQENGKFYADVNCLTNSTYVLIHQEKSFTDVEGKWYKNIVSEMASREIIRGYQDGSFGGDDSVTRAEFAAILVRALGLDPERSKSADVFTDVNSQDWYYGAVGMAADYELVSGRTVATFDPTAKITRQEAMLMVQRACAITELNEGSKDYSTLNGLEKVSDWANAGVMFNLKTNLIQGNNTGDIDPLGNITRAETATIILRMMQMSNLFDVRNQTK